MRKAADEVENGNANVVVMLVAHRAGSDWFTEAERLASHIVKLGRFRWPHSGHEAHFPCVLLVFERERRRRRYPGAMRKCRRCREYFLALSRHGSASKRDSWRAA